MKVRLLALLTALALLAGCAAAYPDRDLAGNPWDDNWTMLGGDFGIETPGYEFGLYNNNMALAANDMYMVTWVRGEPREYVNADGVTNPCYDAEVYALLITYKDAASAAADKADWVAQANEMYAVNSQTTETHNGQDYTVMTYTYGDGADTPYERGASAFAAFDRYAVTVELSCSDLFDEDALTVLQSVLDGCHIDEDIAG